MMKHLELTGKGRRFLEENVEDAFEEINWEILYSIAKNLGLVSAGTRLNNVLDEQCYTRFPLLGLGGQLVRPRKIQALLLYDSLDESDPLRYKDGEKVRMFGERQLELLERYLVGEGLVDSSN